uniref:Uncharacterized protein n=1 Tax=Ascaris lumbricoides TaxID=6252 RepID=A0A0M3HX17_ASCLU
MSVGVPSFRPSPLPRCEDSTVFLPGLRRSWGTSDIFERHNVCRTYRNAGHTISCLLSTKHPLSLLVSRNSTPPLVLKRYYGA